MPNFEHLELSVNQKIAHIKLNRPEKANALNEKIWNEIKEVFEWIDATSDIRVGLISGNGKHFCGGIDLSLLGQIAQGLPQTEEGRKREKLRQIILKFQSAFTAIEKCSKPIIAAVHSSCIGAGLDLITACDLRYASEDARFILKEIDMGMVADVGTLQRLPHIVGDAFAKEMAYTGRVVSAAEAQAKGLVSHVFPSFETLIEGTQKIASTIAQKSPLAVRGTKEILRYTRDHTVDESLNYIATWNSAMLLTEDLQIAMMAQMEKKQPEFKD